MDIGFECMSQCILFLVRMHVHPHVRKCLHVHTHMHGHLRTCVHLHVDDSAVGVLAPYFEV